MIGKIYASSALSDDQVKALQRDTGSTVLPVSDVMERHSPIMCEYCGNRSHWRIDMEFDIVGQISDGNLVLPDIHGQVSDLLNNLSSDDLLFALGFLNCLQERELIDGQYRDIYKYPWSLDDGGPLTDTSLDALYRKSFEDCVDAFSEAILDGHDIRCVVCSEEGIVRDFGRSGGPWHGRHDHQCKGCFICSKDFLSKSSVAEWCTDNMAEVLTDHFTSDELKLGSDYVAKNIDRLRESYREMFDCVECQKYFSCLNYNLSLDSPEIVAPAVNMALDGERANE